MDAVDAPDASEGGASRPLADERRNARLYLVGMAGSLVGTSAMTLVAGIWVKSLTGSSARAGLVSACVYAPAVLGLLAGLAADRIDRRRLLVSTNLAAAGAVASLLAVAGPAQLWLIYLVMSAYGLAMVVIDPAETALFAQMLPTGLRRRLNGLAAGDPGGGTAGRAPDRRRPLRASRRWRRGRP